MFLVFPDLGRDTELPCSETHGSTDCEKRELEGGENAARDGGRARIVALSTYNNYAKLAGNEIL